MTTLEPRNATPAVAHPPDPPTEASLQDVGFKEAVLVWAKIGLLSFGGPAGQIALMHRVLVEEKRWLSEARFLHALNFCMLLPGPEAQQLATYVGWLLHRVKGGLVAGLLFILPGFLTILGLSYLYVMAGQLVVVQGLFLGLKAAVIAIVIQALLRIGKRSLKTNLQFSLSIMAFMAMFVFAVPFPFVVLAAAIVGLVATRPVRPIDGDSALPSPPRWQSSARVTLLHAVAWLTPIAILHAMLGPENVFAQISVFFSKMAVVTFGGAYAVLSYVAQEAVQTQAWLTASQMIDGLAMAETTPGPLIMVVQFVGFLAGYQQPGDLTPNTAALAGSVLTTWVTFVPCFLWIFLFAPYMERLRQNRRLANALSAVTAAVVGVVANLAAWFTIQALFTEQQLVVTALLSMELPVLASLRVPSLLITLVAIFMIFGLRVSVPVALAGTGILGIVQIIVF